MTSLSEIAETKFGILSRRMLIKVLFILGGTVAAGAMVRCGSTEVAAALPVFPKELLQTKRYFHEWAQDIMGAVYENWEGLVSRMELRGNIVFFSKERPDLAKPLARFEAESIEKLKEVVQDIHVTYSTRKITVEVNEDPMGVLKRDNAAWDQIQVSRETYTPGRLNIERFSGTIENPISGKSINFEFRASNPDHKAESFNKKGVVFYFRGIDKIHADDEIMLDKLIQEGYGVLTIGYAEGEAFPKEAVIKFDDQVDIETIARNFPEIRKLDYHEYEDAYTVLCMLVASKLIGKDTPIHTIGVSYGAVQCINFALLAQAGGHTIGKVLSYAGMHDLLHKRFTSTPSDLLRLELLHTRYLLPNQGRTELLRLSPRHTVPFITLRGESLVLVAGDSDKLISPEHTIEFAKSMPVILRDLYIIPGLGHSPDKEYVENFNPSSKLSKVMSGYERRKLRRILQELQATLVFDFSELLLRLGRFIAEPMTQQTRRELLRIPK